MELREKNIKKNEVVTTHVPDCQKLSCDIRASLGHANITMHSVMNNRCEVPVGCITEVIVHVLVCDGIATSDSDDDELLRRCAIPITDELPPKKQAM